MPTCRNLSVKMGLTGCPETSVRNYNATPREIREESGFQVLCSFCQSFEFVPNTLVYYLTYPWFLYPVFYLASHSVTQYKLREVSQVLDYETQSHLA